MKSLAEKYADAISEVGIRGTERLIFHLRECGLLSVLPAIVRVLENRSRRAAEQYTVTSARKLSGSALKEIKNLIPPDAELHQKVDAQIIGGMRVKLGDDLFDRSVRGALESLHVLFKN